VLVIVRILSSVDGASPGGMVMWFLTDRIVRQSIPVVVQESASKPSASFSALGSRFSALRRDPRKRAMTQPRFGMIILQVADMTRSLAFYRRLGMELPEGSESKTSVRFDLGEGRILFWNITFAPENDPDRIPPAGGSRILLEFFVKGDEAVDALHTSLIAAGYQSHRVPFRATFGAYMAMVDDPDGNTVLITAE
jgi:catechol 2,3-dioxygenase-like lactoylglutathione lyase family enzyme